MLELSPITLIVHSPDSPCLVLEKLICKDCLTAFHRFILADTDRLHQKISTMSDRIRQLEDALAILQSSISRETHPLLRRELLDIKSGLTLHSATNLKPSQPGSEEVQDEEGSYVDAFGTLAVRDDGAATFYGRSAGTEVSDILIPSANTPNDPDFNIP